jgi:hypothetical protein
MVVMATWQKTREPPKTKAELREMLAQAVRNPSLSRGLPRPAKISLRTPVPNLNCVHF